MGNLFSLLPSPTSTKEFLRYYSLVRLFVACNAAHYWLQLTFDVSNLTLQAAIFTFFAANFTSYADDFASRDSSILRNCRYCWSMLIIMGQEGHYEKDLVPKYKDILVRGLNFFLPWIDPRHLTLAQPHIAHIYWTPSTSPPPSESVKALCRKGNL